MKRIVLVSSDCLGSRHNRLKSFKAIPHFRLLNDFQSLSVAYFHVAHHTKYYYIFTHEDLERFSMHFVGFQMVIVAYVGEPCFSLPSIEGCLAVGRDSKLPHLLFSLV